MSKKFIETLDLLIYRRAAAAARRRGLTVQQLIRAVVVPDYVRRHRVHRK